MTTSKRLARQGSYHFVLTTQRLIGGQMLVATTSGAFTPPEGATRSDVYQWLLSEHVRTYPELASGTVTLFQLEPNHL